MNFPGPERNKTSSLYPPPKPNIFQFPAPQKRCKLLLTILQDLDLKHTLHIVICEDKISCIKQSKNDKHQARTKHINVKFHNVKHMRDNGVISLHYCPSKLMTADVLPKPLPKPQFETLRGTTATVTPMTFTSKVGGSEEK